MIILQNPHLMKIHIIYFPDISTITKKEETNESFLCLPKSFKRNANNFINMSYMFSNCSSLLSLPNISVWKTNDTGNMVNMSHMFSNCYSLLSLPDISKWDMNNVIDMSYMFSNIAVR